MIVNTVINYVLGQAQRTYNSAVSDPKSTFAGVGYAGAIVAGIEYIQQTLGCNLHKLDFVALFSIWQGMRARDTKPTSGDAEHVANGGNSF